MPINNQNLNYEVLYQTTPAAQATLIQQFITQNLHDAIDLKYLRSLKAIQTFKNDFYDQQPLNSELHQIKPQTYQNYSPPEIALLEATRWLESFNQNLNQLKKQLPRPALNWLKSNLEYIFIHTKYTQNFNQSSLYYLLDHIYPQLLPKIPTLQNQPHQYRLTFDDYNDLIIIVNNFHQIFNRLWDMNTKQPQTTLIEWIKTTPITTWLYQKPKAPYKDFKTAILKNKPQTQTSIQFIIGIEYLCNHLINQLTQWYLQNHPDFTRAPTQAMLKVAFNHHLFNNRSLIKLINHTPAAKQHQKYIIRKHHQYYYITTLGPFKIKHRHYKFDNIFTT